MSAMTSFKLAAVGLAALSMTACATSSNADRYGNVYDYEGTGECAAAPNACGGQVASTSTRYGDYVEPAPVYAPQTENVIYADCSVIQGMNCGPTYQPAPTQVYTAPVQAPVYSAPATSYSAPTSCPAGTTPSSDGTCLQGSSSYSSTSSYSAPATSYSAPTTSYIEPVSCPAGTTPSSDGTCLQSYSSTSSYTAPSTSYSSTSSYSSSSSYGETAACPSGSTKQADGSCAMNEGMSTNIEIFTDATPSTYGGYTSSGGYTANDYLPVRK